MEHLEPGAKVLKLSGPSWVVNMHNEEVSLTLRNKGDVEVEKPQETFPYTFSSTPPHRHLDKKPLDSAHPAFLRERAMCRWEPAVRSPGFWAWL